MSKKEKIYELLENDILTVQEIANKLLFNENETRVYINRLMHEGRIIKKGRKGYYILYTTKDNENINALDTKILKKMIKPFAEEGIKINLKQKEIDRINKLYKVNKDS